MNYRTVDRCRICQNPHLERVLDLGEQMLTGVFPRERNANITIGPLRLMKCIGGDEVCGLVQLEHSYDLGEMYGQNYGYRSGLNASMVDHLQQKVKKIVAEVDLQAGDLVIDIGSNDSTTLQAYPALGLTLVGVDPTAIKFGRHYPSYIQLIPDFFSASLVKQHFSRKKAKVITSFSMLYDLEDPTAFMRQVHEVLADDGIWVFEQSYMPAMLAANAYDTVCHEHLEYYGLRQIKWMCDRVGFAIQAVTFNDVNAGSISITVSKNTWCSEKRRVQTILDEERNSGLDSLAPYRAFAKRVADSRVQLRDFIATARSRGQSVAALGASTKGNVLLQYCGLTASDIRCIGEVNEEKFGCYTPGTWIPIIPEEELLSSPPDYLLVLPWHFRKYFETCARFTSMKLVFPLPVLSNAFAEGQMCFRLK